jgi:fused signal recognition particle receptor
MAGFNWFRRAFDKSDKTEAETKPAEPQTEEKQESAPSEPAPPTQQQLSPEDYLTWAKAAYQNIQKQQTAPEAESEATRVPDKTQAVEPASEVQAPAAAEGVSAPAATPETALVETPGLTPEAETEGEEAPTAPAEPVASAPAAEIAASPAASENVDVETSAVAEAEPSQAEPAAVEAEVETQPPEAEPVEVAPPGEPQEAEPVASTVSLATAAREAAETTAVPAESTPPEPAVPFWARADEERQQRLERLKETAIVEPEPEPQPQPVAAQAPPEPVMPDIDLDEAFLWSAEVLAAQGRRPDDVSIEEITWLNKLRQGLNKTRLSLVNQLKSIVGQGPLNEDAVMEIEALLLQADVGIEATDKVIASLQERMRDEVLPPDQAIAYLKSLLRDMLDAPLGDSHNLLFVPEKDTLNIWLMTGVNGAGKTTTIGKLAHIAKKSGYNTIIAAADTFRAAAVEQVKAWGARSDVEVIANPGKNTDPAAVVYDAIAAAQSRQAELLLVDTAGRLQNKKNLMAELAKIRRIVDKKAANAKVESLLVLDATLGQNGLRQAEVFAEAANLSGVVLTKLDGTAKGGIALAVTQQLGLPIRFIGAGEGIEDLRPFSSFEFVEALLSG